MSRSPRKPISSSSQAADSTAVPSPVRVKVWVAAQKRSPLTGWQAALLTLFLLMGMAGAVVGGTWVAIRLIVNPGSVGWLSWMLPEWNRGLLSQKEPPKTLAEIEAEAEQLGLFLGAPLPLTVSASDQTKSQERADILIPLMARRSQCREAIATTPPSSACRQIEGLSIYRPLPPTPAWRDGEPRFIRVAQIAVQGLEESYVVAPLIQLTDNRGIVSRGSSRTLPLSSASLVEGQTSAPGTWIYLSGEWVRGSNRILYGQLVHYDATQTRLEQLANWSSPAGKSPRWQEVTGGDLPEILVDQTVGLKPQFQVHQVQAERGLELSAISLTEAALNDVSYKNSLDLARNGLWSPALQLIEAVKARQNAADWPVMAQSQLDLIALHANFTKAQADRNWASPGQQIMAQLMDGRWSAALQKFQSAMKDGYAIPRLLESDSGDLWNRVQTALRADSTQADVQLWGALLLAVRQGQEPALNWLKQQQNYSNTLRDRAQLVLNLLDEQPTSPATSAVTTVSSPSRSSHTSRLIGSVTSLATVNPADWLYPDDQPLPAAASQPGWYQIQVSDFYDGQRWQRSPFTSFNPPAAGPAQFFWQQLGLSSNATLDIVYWTPENQPETIQATVRGVQFQNGALLLLASGRPLPEPELPASGTLPSSLATTLQTLPWVSLNQTTTLTELNQRDSAWTGVLLPNLWQELQQTRQVLPTDAVTPEAMLETLGAWSVQLIDLTGNDRPEAVLTFQANLIAAANLPALAAEHSNPLQDRTLIFSDQGQLIYSELSDRAGQRLVAIADIGENQTALVIEGPQRYTLQRWSTQTQRFD